MSELDQAMSLAHVACIREHSRELVTAIESEDWMTVRLRLSFIGIELTNIAKTAERLAAGAIPTTAEDAEVLPVKEVATLREWKYVVDCEIV